MRDNIRWIMRWITAPGTLIVVAVIVLVLGVYGTFWWKTGRTNLKPDEPLLLVLIFSAAVAGFLFNSAAKFHSEMRDRAFNLLQTNNITKPYLEAYANVFRTLRRNKDLSQEKIVKIYVSKDARDIQFRNDIKVVGNFFEEMAIAIKCKEANEELLEEFYIGLFIRFYESIQRFIPVIRNNPKIPNSPFEETSRIEVYSSLDWLYERWKPRYQALVEELREKHRLERRRNEDAAYFLG